MDYDKDVLDDAVEFLHNHEDDIKEAIVEDTEFSDICNGHDWIHEDVADRSYTLRDAVYIIENCENEETDTGLWEGCDAREMISRIAAYSYSTDVWFKAEELCDAMKLEYECLIDELETNVDEYDETLVDSIFKDFINEHTII